MRFAIALIFWLAITVLSIVWPTPFKAIAWLIATGAIGRYLWLSMKHDDVESRL